MPNFITKNEERIKQTIDFLAVNRRPITVKIEEEQPLFDSMILKVDRGDPVSKAGTAGRVFIEWLSPLKGNDLIQSAYQGTAHFNPLIDVAMLFVFILIFQVLANRLYKKFNA